MASALSRDAMTRRASGVGEGKVEEAGLIEFPEFCD
jgi:hypothetical protein